MAAAVISNLYRDIDLLFFIPKHVTKLPVTNTLKRWGLMILSFLITVLIGNLIPLKVENYFDWAILACIAALLAIIVVILNAILFDRKAFLGLINRLKAVIKR